MLELDLAIGGDLLVAGKAFHITKEGKKGASYLCNTRAFNNENKLQFKSGWLWVKRYKGTDYCLFFFDPESETFVNVADNDKSVLISIGKKSRWRKKKIELKLFNTNKYAPGPHPYTYGGPSGRQIVTNSTGSNILCYKFLNNYQLKSATWVKAQTFKLRHHKGCNFNLFYVEYDASKLKPKHPWRDAKKEEKEAEDDKEDDSKEDEAESAGDENEKKNVKKPKKEEDDDDDGAPDDDDDKPKPTKPEAKPKKRCDFAKGELNPDYGLIVEEPFFINTMLPSGRFLDIVAGEFVIKTQNARDTQVWWFDQKTKTIKSKSDKTKSWNIANSGKSTKMQLWNTNEGWF
jgi:hypothetical protein